MTDLLIRRLTDPPFGTETSERNLMAEAARALLDARAELAATQTQVGDWIVRADEANVKVEKLESELARVKADAAAALVEAQAEVARLSTLEGAADRVLRFITDPDWADQNSEVFRTTPWQALYNEMQKDRGDFPAMVRTFLEAFACADFRDELRRAALLPVARDGMEG